VSPILAKAYSEAVAACYVYHGWKLSSVHRAQSDPPPYEYLLSWELPEQPRRPVDQEQALFVQLCVVEDRFLIRDRGVIVTPGIRSGTIGLKAAEGDLVVVLADGASSAYPASLPLGLNLKNPDRPLLLRGAEPDLVPVGCSLWSRSSTL